MTQGRVWDRAGRSIPHDFRSLLIPVDLSPATERVVERAALLPLAKNAQLTLLHVVPRLLSREARRLAESDATKALQHAVRNVAAKLPESVKVMPSVKVGVAAAEIARHARSCKAELIVMGRGGGRTLRDIFLGSTAERVIRKGQLPVLVVRLQPHGAYRRPLLALDTDQAAQDVLTLTLRVLPPPRPQIGLVHAYDVPYHGLIYPSLSPDQGQEFRHHYRQKALHDIARALATALADMKASHDDAPSWKSHVRYGSPRTVIADTVAKAGADLLVLGTHGRAGVAHALLGTVAGDVLREVPCDVLVVPPRPQGSGRS
ncbi:universal stress protein [Hyalangium sp.]|uniref:universal stress protein n=1 Tax=Hyalangium sp. TaxID=2028555 RepID=UPI002D391435|nr:universal stress protein [Hyalangium sp.]HYH97223.1 universal stress protein [Hyalangium sp.]